MGQKNVFAKIMPENSPNPPTNQPKPTNQTKKPNPHKHNSREYAINNWKK
jgi:hypothetical protein